MQVVINIQPENEEKFIQALDDSGIPYWIEENKPALTQDVSSDEEAARDYMKATGRASAFTDFLIGCQHGRQYSITKP